MRSKTMNGKGSERSERKRTSTRFFIYLVMHGQDVIGTEQMLSPRHMSLVGVFSLAPLSSSSGRMA